MRQGILVLMVAMGLASACFAQGKSFYLKLDETGKLYGPYEFVDGSKVRIGRGVFTVVKGPEAKPVAATVERAELEMPTEPVALADLLESVRIKQFIVYETGLQATLDYLAIKCREAKHGAEINFVVAVGGKEPPMVTLNLKNTSARQILDLIADISQWEYKIDTGMVVFGPASEPAVVRKAEDK